MEPADVFLVGTICVGVGWAYTVSCASVSVVDVGVGVL